jgi:hypothetical protein
LRWKPAVVAMAVGACALLGLTGVGASAAAGRRPVGAHLTIADLPRGVFGYVSSRDAARCAKGRRIEVFAKGVNGNPGKGARRIATQIVTRNQVGLRVAGSCTRCEGVIRRGSGDAWLRGGTKQDGVTRTHDGPARLSFDCV